jgi:hypothetical protein
MLRTQFFEARLRQGRLDAKTLDSMFRRRIEEGANCSPFVSQAILAMVKEVFGLNLTRPRTSSSSSTRTRGKPTRR